MDKLFTLWFRITEALETSGHWVAYLGLRIVLGYEYWDSGVTKFQGQNWFGSIQGDFPFPFNVIPPDISWFMAMWFEILGGIAIFLGLFTRFFSASLIILTIVATAAVHWPGEWSSFAELAKGYAISDDGYGNYKLPAIFLVMFLPLLFNGPGKASLDHWIRKWAHRRVQESEQPPF